ncbi:hypothetical protein AB4090_03275 [Acidithiobacillus sp. IBUN Pt1247-S3]|uniref:hypothetical protein n=1 Tax=Acidithiobacillus sp. IBUN Pt1247-S3 TaxID=3166642 RepID=UPI0034E4767C
MSHRSARKVACLSLVDSEQVYARLFSRDGDTWREQVLDPEDVVQIDCGGLAIHLSLDDFYEDTGLLVASR